MGKLPEGQRTKDVARAALLRERILGALKAAVDGMTHAQLCDWPSVAELYHKGMLVGRVHAQLGALRRQGIIEQVGSKPHTYFMKRKRAEEAAQLAAAPAELKHLQLEVSKSKHTISFVFEGLQITVKVLP